MGRGWRYSIGMIAAVCVLLHGAMIVRHASMLLGTQIAYGDLVASLGVICHGSGASETAPPEDLPNIPSPSSAGNCPICAGAAMPVVLLQDRQIIRPPADPASIRHEIIAELVAGRLTAVCPPSTGPPLRV